MKRLTLTLLTTLFMPMGASLLAQTAGTSVAAPAGSSSATDGGMNVNNNTNSNQNAQSAQANSIQANPGQTREQATGGGVFGPSSGPGIFGPAGQTGTQAGQNGTVGQAVTTDIYGNQQPTTGTVAQPNQPSTSAQGMQNRGSQRPGQASGQAANPTVYDASGNPVPANNLYRGELPRDLNPITPSGTQPSQTAPAGTVTGR